MRVFVAWRRISARTRDLAGSLRAKLVFIRSGPPYIRACIETKRVLEELRPQTVIVQLPQGPLLYRVAQLRDRLGYVLVADVHTAMVVHDTLKSLVLNKPFTRYLRRADIVVVHNRLVARLVEEKIGVEPSRILVVYDPPPRMEPVEEPPFAKELGEFILVPAGWAADEPLEEIVEAFCASKASSKYRLVLTGDYGRARRRATRIASMCRAVMLTGFLPAPQYNWLVRNATAVIAATLREYTFLRAAWEAIVLHKPLLASRTRTMEDLLGADYPGLFNPRSGDLERLLGGLAEGNLIEELRASVARLAERLVPEQRSMLEELDRRIRELETSKLECGCSFTR
ncbi:hypothetical protein Pyrfu_0577 [Pyrolobus fumarii 1A]|uniref:Glycosyltransferase subfamily 4-like N-terminal domain-containing protein n=1 Tax=Pyrolobus fumarii (strain DSM 11204 / 1A) TaxID=694429 RepID=G0EGZ7_PYRF1|nr:glycosyltransferase [Pyrolobus fumarii]AEM38447.1 hypothetical protein Pyrfu_0577 [Pyrolobus fumarii 1A]